MGGTKFSLAHTSQGFLSLLMLRIVALVLFANGRVPKNQRDVLHKEMN
jgi:hypothetical protein